MWPNNGPWNYGNFGPYGPAAPMSPVTYIPVPANTQQTDIERALKILEKLQSKREKKELKENEEKKKKEGEKKKEPEMRKWSNVEIACIMVILSPLIYAAEKYLITHMDILFK